MTAPPGAGSPSCASETVPWAWSCIRPAPPTSPCATARDVAGNRGEQTILRAYFLDRR